MKNYIVNANAKWEVREAESKGDILSELELRDLNVSEIINANLLVNIITKYEVLEDNGGHIFLVIKATDGHVTHIFDGFEFGEHGELANLLPALDNADFNDWDGNLLTYVQECELNRDGVISTKSSQELYDSICGDVIACNSWYRTDMGYAGQATLDCYFG